MYNTSRMVVFLLVLGEGVEGAFCRFDHELLPRYCRGVGVGVRDVVAKMNKTNF